jgi:hypothetical protein
LREVTPLRCESGASCSQLGRACFYNSGGSCAKGRWELCITGRTSYRNQEAEVWSLTPTSYCWAAFPLVKCRTPALTFCYYLCVKPSAKLMPQSHGDLRLAHSSHHSGRWDSPQCIPFDPYRLRFLA